MELELDELKDKLARYEKTIAKISNDNCEIINILKEKDKKLTELRDILMPAPTPINENNAHYIKEGFSYYEVKCPYCKFPVLRTHLDFVMVYDKLGEILRN